MSRTGKKRKGKKDKVKNGTSMKAFIVFAALFLFLIFGLAHFKIATTLVAPSQQTVLGDEDKKQEEEKKEEEKKNEEKQREESKKQEEQKKEEEEKKQEQSQQGSTNSTTSSDTSGRKSGSSGESSKPVEFKIQQEGSKQETEIKYPDGRKVKTKIEDDGRVKIEAEDEKLKIKYTFENGKLTIKAENEFGKEIEVEDEKLEKLKENAENELKDDDIEIATENGELAIRKNNVRAVSQFPLSIDPVTRTLQVTTPAGVKIVTVLPDQAVQNILSQGILSKIDSTDSETGTEEKIKIEIRNEEVVYKISGKKGHKFLGFIPIQTTRDVIMSSETGTPLTQEQSLLSSFIDFLSPD